MMMGRKTCRWNHVLPWRKWGTIILKECLLETYSKIVKKVLFVKFIY